jgi:hypothetical protein
MTFQKENMQILWRCQTMWLIPMRKYDSIYPIILAGDFYRETGEIVRRSFTRAQNRVLLEAACRIELFIPCFEFLWPQMLRQLWLF